MPLSALIGVGGSLLGGLFGKSSARKAQDRQNEYNSPVQVRARAEQAGFNPLLFVGPGVGQQAAPEASGHMGAAIADSSMMIANAMTGKAEEKARVDNLELQNEKLRKEINNMTLRPKTAGIYGVGVMSNAPKWADSDMTTARPPQRGMGNMENVIDERPDVIAYNANAYKWQKVPAGVAEKLDLKTGDTILADAQTQWRGEIVGEATTLGNFADGITHRSRSMLDSLWNRATTSAYGPRVNIAPPTPHPNISGNSNKRQPLKLKFTGP